jgi:hypothetical protein
MLEGTQTIDPALLEAGKQLEDQYEALHARNFNLFYFVRILSKNIHAYSAAKLAFVELLANMRMALDKVHTLREIEKAHTVPGLVAELKARIKHLEQHFSQQLLHTTEKHDDLDISPEVAEAVQQAHSFIDSMAHALHPQQHRNRFSSIGEARSAIKKRAGVISKRNRGLEREIHELLHHWHLEQHHFHKIAQLMEDVNLWFEKVLAACELLREQQREGYDEAQLEYSHMSHEIDQHRKEVYLAYHELQEMMKLKLERPHEHDTNVERSQHFYLQYHPFYSHLDPYEIHAYGLYETPPEPEFESMPESEPSHAKLPEPFSLKPKSPMEL